MNKTEFIETIKSDIPEDCKFIKILYDRVENGDIDISVARKIVIEYFDCMNGDNREDYLFNKKTEINKFIDDVASNIYSIEVLKTKKSFVLCRLLKETDNNIRNKLFEILSDVDNKINESV